MLITEKFHQPYSKDITVQKIFVLKKMNKIVVIKEEKLAKA